MTLVVKNNVKEIIGNVLDLPVEYYIVSEIAEHYNFKLGINYKLNKNLEITENFHIKKY